MLRNESSGRSLSGGNHDPAVFDLALDPGRKFVIRREGIRLFIPDPFDLIFCQGKSSQFDIFCIPFPAFNRESSRVVMTRFLKAGGIDQTAAPAFLISVNRGFFDTAAQLFL